MTNTLKSNWAGNKSTAPAIRSKSVSRDQRVLIIHNQKATSICKGLIARAREEAKAERKTRTAFFQGLHA